MLRAVAACGVVVFHAGGPGLGAAGVDLFFVISGFIIATVAPGKAPIEFLAARAWRIYPLWWILCLPWFFAVALMGGLSLASTAATATLFPLAGVAKPYLAPGWTLMFEMLFYVAATVALVTRRAWPLIVAWLTATITNYFWPTPFFAYLGCPLILEFLLGAGIARLPRDARVGGGALAGGALLLLMSPAAVYADFTIIITDPDFYGRAIHWGIPAAMIVYGTLSLERYFTGWSLPWVFVGDASYSIYLAHSLPLRFYYGPVVAAALLAIVVGIAVHLAIERPLAWIGKQSRRRPAPVSA